MTRDCNKLGEFTLSGIPPAPRGIPQIEITYDVDANSILNVTAMEKTTGKKMSITIKNDAGHRSKEDVDKMVKDAEKFAEEDHKNLERIEAKNHLESYVYQMKNSLADIKDKITPEEVSSIETTVQEAIEWLNQHQSSEKPEYDQKREEIDKVINPIMMKMYKAQGGAEGGPQGPQGPKGPQAPQSEPKKGPTISDVD
jgi:L1 cell adhesion molecule like protein